MLTPYKPGDRVVCPDPDGGSFVGTVLDVYDGVDLLVSDGVLATRRLASEVRPVMPRDEDDLKRWGGNWYFEDDIVEVVASRDGAMSMWRFGLQLAYQINPKSDWRGPVQPPPEVR